MASVDELRFVVNRASGGRAGERLIHDLRALSAADAVVDLATCDLAAFVGRAHADGARLVACGGDGTVAAVLAAAHAAGGPAVGIIPLGTGNDLARCHGWHRRQPLSRRLAALAVAKRVALDRWLLRAPPSLGERCWFNYCSWGGDAHVVRHFHHLRDRHPPWFRSPLANQAIYLGLGMVDVPAPLAASLRWPQGPALPASMNSLVIANIASYAGGRRLGRQIAAGDGRCDVFALPSGLALGLRMVGWRRVQGLGAWSTLALVVDRPLSMQLDGEPLLAPPGDYSIQPGGQVDLLMACE